MARITIFFLLLCLGLMGFLFYERSKNPVDVKSFKDRIQFLEKENERLKERKVEQPKPKNEQPEVSQPKKEQPKLPFSKLDIKQGEPLKKN